MALKKIQDRPKAPPARTIAERRKELYALRRQTWHLMRTYEGQPEGYSRLLQEIVRIDAELKKLGVR